MAPSRKRLLSAVLAAYFAGDTVWMMGFVSGPTFERLFDLSRTELGFVLCMPSLGSLLMSLFAGHSTHRLGPLVILAAGLCTAMAACLTAAFSTGLAALSCGLVIVGVSAALIHNANATILANMYSGKLRRAMALASGWWMASSALGAAAVGLWLEFASDRHLGLWGMRVPFLVGCAMCGLCFLVVPSRRMKKPCQTKSDIAAASHTSPSAHPNRGTREWLWIPVLGGCYGLVVAVPMAWLNPMAQSTFDVNDSQGALTVGVFTLGIGLGRFLTGCTKVSWDERVLLAVSGFVGGTLFLWGLFAKTYASSLLAIGVAGLVSGAYIPCIMSLIGERFASMKAKLYGYLYASIALTGMAGSLIVGLLANRGVPIRHALVISPAAAGTLALAGLMWRLTFAGGANRGSGNPEPVDVLENRDAGRKTNDRR